MVRFRCYGTKRITLQLQCFSGYFAISAAHLPDRLIALPRKQAVFPALLMFRCILPSSRYCSECALRQLSSIPGKLVPLKLIARNLITPTMDRKQCQGTCRPRVEAWTTSYCPEENALSIGIAVLECSPTKDGAVYVFLLLFFVL